MTTDPERAQRVEGLIRWLAIGLAVGLAAGSAGIGTAGPLPPPVSVAARTYGADVIVNGRVVISLAGPSASTLAAAAAQRLSALRGPAPPSIAVDVAGGAATLRVNGAVIISVDPALAALRGVAPRPLVAAWGQRIREAISHHRMAVASPVAVLSPGNRVGVAVEVFPRVGIVPSGYDRRVVRVGPSPGGITIFGLAHGSTQVRLRAGTATVVLPVAVRPPAARLPQRVEVSVTGNPADPEFIREAIRQAILTSTSLTPGSVISIGRVSAPPPGPGARSWVRVPVHVRNPSAAPVSGVVLATVENLPLEPVVPARLLVSNRPETVTANGVLFEESLQAGQAVRLLYHHRNGAATSKVITVTLVNRSGDPASVFLTGATAGPSSDVMYAGHIAAGRFVSRITAQQGYVLEIPRRSAHTFSVVDIPPGTLVTGLLQAQLLRGTELAVTVHIRAPWLLARTVTTEVNQVAVAHPRGVFHTAEVHIARSVSVGERILLTDLGFAATPTDPATGEVLRGDYGILYRLSVELKNPGDRPAIFEIAARAVNGPARGMLFIAGTVADFGFLRAGEERFVAAIELAAGETRLVDMLTMPAAASFYPVRLSVQGTSR